MISTIFGVHDKVCQQLVAGQWFFSRYSRFLIQL